MSALRGRVLLRLARAEHPMKASELATELDASLEDVGKVIKRLELTGLVKRAWDTISSGRWVGWKLTADGHYAVKRGRL